MSRRPRRAVLSLIAGVATLAGAPATALAAGEALTVAPASTQAGAETNVSATLSFAAGQTPQTVVTSLAPGMLGNLNANPSCLVGVAQITPACQIGTATIDTAADTFTGSLFLVPPQPGDAAGIELVPGAGPLANQYIGVTLNPKAPGGLNLTTTFPDTGVSHITSFTASFTTLNGQEFTRLPSSCGPATSSFTTTYYGSAAAGSASGSFTPTGCSSLPYAPVLSATLTKDAKDSGVAMALAVAQAANESASKSIEFGLPKGLAPNLSALEACLTATGCKIGTASATSPLIPSAALANGTLTLAAAGLTPVISISFPAPFALTLSGAVNLTSGSVTFAGVPDVPLTALKLSITGPNGKKAFTTTCAAGNISSSFTAQSGATHTSTTPIAYIGCPKPIVTGSTSGLADGHPTLKLKVTHASRGANIASVAIGLPGGLRFSRSAFVSHRTCTTLRGKKPKCTTTTLIKGLGVSGAKAKSVSLKGGELLIGLAKPSASVKFTVSGPLLAETRALRTKAKKHKAGKPTFTLKVTDATTIATTVAVKLAA